MTGRGAARHRADLTNEECLARSRLASDIRLRRIDQALAREQFEHAKSQGAAKGWSALMSPTGVVLVGAALGLIGTAAGKYADYLNTKRQQETAVILKASEVDSSLDGKEAQIQRARNLFWFWQNGYIELTHERSEALRKAAQLEQGQSAPVPVIGSSAVEPDPTITCVNASDIVPKFETFLPTAQKNEFGQMIIGYYHELTPDEVSTNRIVVDGVAITYKDGISESAARSLLKKDMEPSYKAVDELVTVKITPQQRTALASFVFNVGKSNFASSTLLKFVNSNNFAGVPGELAKWSRDKGKVLPALQKRRATEAAIWSCQA